MEMNWIKSGGRRAGLLVAVIHGRLLRGRRRESGRLKIRRRAGEDPTLGIGWPKDALDVADALLESVPGQHISEQLWASLAAVPLAGLLYAASPCGNGEGIAWIGHASANTACSMFEHRAGEAADICLRAGVPLLADGLLRAAGLMPRQRDSVREMIRLAVAPWFLAESGTR